MLIWDVVLITGYTKKSKTLSIRFSQSSKGGRHKSSNISIQYGMYNDRDVLRDLCIIREVVMRSRASQKGVKIYIL